MVDGDYQCSPSLHDPRGTFPFLILFPAVTQTTVKYGYVCMVLERLRVYAHGKY